jgi:hypothetical protein
MMDEGMTRGMRAVSQANDNQRPGGETGRRRRKRPKVVYTIERRQVMLAPTAGMDGNALRSVFEATMVIRKVLADTMLHACVEDCEPVASGISDTINWIEDSANAIRGELSKRGEPLTLWP